MQLILDLSIDILGFEELLDEKAIGDFVKRVIKSEYIPDKPVYLSLYLTSNNVIKGINKEYRGKDSPTDVISFAYHDNDDSDVGPYDVLGDVIVSVERVLEQSSEYGHSFERELFYVLTHGVLHLLGYDHIENEDKIIMRKKEEEILGGFGYTRDFIN